MVKQHRQHSSSIFFAGVLLKTQAAVCSKKKELEMRLVFFFLLGSLVSVLVCGCVFPFYTGTACLVAGAGAATAAAFLLFFLLSSKVERNKQQFIRINI